MPNPNGEWSGRDLIGPLVGTALGGLAGGAAGLFASGETEAEKESRRRRWILAGLLAGGGVGTAVSAGSKLYRNRQDHQETYKIPNELSIKERLVSRPVGTVAAVAQDAIVGNVGDEPKVRDGVLTNAPGNQASHPESSSILLQPFQDAPLLSGGATGGAVVGALASNAATKPREWYFRLALRDKTRLGKVLRDVLAQDSGDVFGTDTAKIRELTGVGSGSKKGGNPSSVSAYGGQLSDRTLGEFIRAVGKSRGPEMLAPSPAVAGQTYDPKVLDANRALRELLVKLDSPSGTSANPASFDPKISPRLSPPAEALRQAALRSNLSTVEARTLPKRVAYYLASGGESPHRAKWRVSGRGAGYGAGIGAVALPLFSRFFPESGSSYAPVSSP